VDGFIFQQDQKLLFAGYYRCFSSSLTEHLSQAKALQERTGLWEMFIILTTAVRDILQRQ